MGEDGQEALLARALESGDPGALVEKLKDPDGLLIEPTAHGLWEWSLTGGDEATAAVAGLVESFMEELPEEQWRLLRRLLLSAACTQFEEAAAAPDGNSARQAICNLLCELFLVDAIPETVIHDCLEQLLWDIRDPIPADVECACAILQSVGPLLDDSDLDAAEELMDDLFSRLSQLAADDVLPAQLSQTVDSLLSQRKNGWQEGPEFEAGPVIMLPQRGGSRVEAEDWRAVLDSKPAEGAASGDAGQAAGAGEAAGPATAGGGDSAVEVFQQSSQPKSAEQQKAEAVEQVVAAAGPPEGAWDVAAVQQAVQQYQAVLNLSTLADAERLIPALLDRAASSAVAAATAAAAAGGSTADSSLRLLQPLPPPIDSCASLVAQLAQQWPAAGEAAVSHLAAAFKHRAEARSPAARQQLGQQMLLAGVLAQRGVLPEAQLQGLLEQLARQVMKPSPSDVVCLCCLLRGVGAGSTGDSKKGAWWKAASQLAGSSNVSAEHQRDLQQLLLLRDCRWDAAAAAQAVQEKEAREKADAAAAALAEATREREAQEEAAARAAAAVKQAEDQVKAAAEQLALLQQQQAAAQAAAAAAQSVRKEAEAAADAAARRRTESDKAASAARKQVQEAQAQVVRAKQEAAAAATSAAGKGSGGGGGGGDEGEPGRHWYCASVGEFRGMCGPFTAAELVAWMYQDATLAGRVQAIRTNEQVWTEMDLLLSDILAELPKIPPEISAATPAAAPPAAPTGGRGGRGGRGRSSFEPPPGRGRGRGRGGRGSETYQPSQPPQQQDYQPAPTAGYASAPPAQQGQPAPGRGRYGSTGPGRAGPGRGGRGPFQGRGPPQQQYEYQAPPAAAPAARPYSQGPPHQYQQQQQNPQQNQQQNQQQGFRGYGPSSRSSGMPAPAAAAQPPERPASPPLFGVDEALLEAYGAPPAAASSSYDPYHVPQQAQQAQQAQQQPVAQAIGLCPQCGQAESCYLWRPCNHLGHCRGCLTNFFGSEDVPDGELLMNIPICLVCKDPVNGIVRIRT